MYLRIVVYVLCLVTCGCTRLLAAEPDFARDVRPLLSQYCFKCHGPDEKTREGGLRLDDRTSALAGGDSQTPAIVPGQTQRSELIKRITSQDPDVVMPPPSAKRALSADQIDVLTRWVQGGALYSEHWAFQSPNNHPAAMPEPVGTGVIDSLVAQHARQRNLTLAEPADRATWLRRVYLDVIGLPPSYEEVQQYVHDARPMPKNALSTACWRRLHSGNVGGGAG